MSGNIQNMYRDLEAKQKELKEKADSLGLKYTIEPLFSGNIWDCVRVLERNVENLKNLLFRFSTD